MELIITLLVLIIICGIVGIVYVIYYTQMQYLNNKIEQSTNKINESFSDRYDLINKASEIIKSNIDDNKDYLKEYVNLKNKNINNFDKDKKLTEGINLIKTLYNDNKVLEDNKDMKNILKEIKETDEKLTASKNYFNKNTTELNGMIRKFPSNIVAKINKYKISQLYSVKKIDDDIKL